MKNKKKDKKFQYRTFQERAILGIEQLAKQEPVTLEEAIK